ncbi:MAG: hypothetical protein WCZ90_18105 [Melioribacteraceae bacterium]
MNKCFVIATLLLLILINPSIKSQSLKLGFRVEPGILFSEQNNESSISFSPYGLYLTTLFEPIDWLTLEVRPGMFLAGEDYSGYEIGAFIRLKIPSTSFYFTTGLNNHSNWGGNDHNSGGSYKKEMLFKGIGVGYQKDSKFSIDVNYYWTNNKDYAYLIDSSTQTYSRVYNKQVTGILKLGFSLAWELL